MDANIGWCASTFFFGRCPHFLHFGVQNHRGETTPPALSEHGCTVLTLISGLVKPTLSPTLTLFTKGGIYHYTHAYLFDQEQKMFSTIKDCEFLVKKDAPSRNLSQVLNKDLVNGDTKIYERNTHQLTTHQWLWKSPRVRICCSKIYLNASQVSK